MTPEELLGPPHPADPPGYVDRKVAVIALNAAVLAEREATKKVLEDLYEVGPLDRSEATAAWVQAWGSGILDAADIVGGRIAMEARTAQGDK